MCIRDSICTSPSELCTYAGAGSRPQCRTKRTYSARVIDYVHENFGDRHEEPSVEIIGGTGECFAACIASLRAALPPSSRSSSAACVIRLLCVRGRRGLYCFTSTFS